MPRRLYFLFPNRRDTRKAIDELEQYEHLREHQFHVLARDDVDLEGLPAATPRQRQDTRARLARVFWLSDLGIYFVALLLLISTLLLGYYLAATIALALMLVTFLGGAWYAIRIPEISLKEFASTLAHKELLLMIDIPSEKMDSIERRINKHHHTGVSAGSSWTIGQFGL